MKQAKKVKVFTLLNNMKKKELKPIKPILKKAKRVLFQKASLFLKNSKILCTSIILLLTVQQAKNSFRMRASLNVFLENPPPNLKAHVHPALALNHLHPRHPHAPAHHHLQHQNAQFLSVVNQHPFQKSLRHSQRKSQLHMSLLQQVTLQLLKHLHLKFTSQHQVPLQRMKLHQKNILLLLHHCEPQHLHLLLSKQLQRLLQHLNLMTTIKKNQMSQHLLLLKSLLQKQNHPHLLRNLLLL